MRIIGAILIIVAIYLWWANRGDKAKVRQAFGILALGLVVFNIGYGHQIHKQRVAESSSSSFSSSLKADEKKQAKKDSESEKEDTKVTKARVKNTCNALNEEMSQYEELQGFKLKPSNGAGNQFVAIVPDSVTGMSDNEQESAYRSLVKLIYSYDNDTNEGAQIEFEDQTGTPVARSSYTGSGEVKLLK